mmetsp:Transcript_728/g.1328  ORF Transcript_728/g.1328 Transcript_728/m.1328 type:complete len:495 (+) Transcript_728:29-1513(+)
MAAGAELASKLRPQEEETSPEAPKEKTSRRTPEEEVSSAAPREEGSPRAHEEETADGTPQEEVSPKAPQEECSPRALKDETSRRSLEEGVSPKASKDESSLLAPKENSRTAPKEEVTPAASKEEASPTAPRLLLAKFPLRNDSGHPWRSVRSERSAVSVHSARSGQSAKSQAGHESAIHGMVSVVASDSEYTAGARMKLELSHTESFQDVAVEPPLHMPDRAHPKAKSPAKRSNDLGHMDFSMSGTDLEGNEEVETEGKAISISISVPHGNRKHGPKKKPREQLGCLRAPCWWRPCWRRCGLAMSLLLWSLLVVCGACVGLFWPRNLSWQVTALQVDSDALMTLVQKASALGLEETAQDQSLVPVQFLCEADVRNDNLLGAESRQGQLVLSFEGREVGAAEIMGTSVPANSRAAISSEGTIQVGSHLLSAFAGELTSRTPTLTFEVLATSDIETLIGVLHYRMRCALDISIPDLLMAETRARALTSRDCEYSYF